MSVVRQTADAVVVGGGVMGLFVAWHLAERGVGRVVVLEKRFVGAGSSGKSGAILRQHYSHATTVAMSRESLAFYAAFAGAHGRDIGFRNTGMVFLCHEGDRPALEANVTLQRDLGVAVEVLDAEGLRALEPRARFEDDVIGAWESEAGYVDPARVLPALTGLLRGRGVEVREGARVADVVVEGGAVAGVRLADGSELATRTVVNAGGPWAGILCRRLGLDLPLTAIRPEQAFFEPPASFGSERLVYGDLLTGLYWKPEPTGWTRVGKMSYEGDEEVRDPDDYDEGVSGAFVAACRAKLAERVPAYRDAVAWGGCAALYTVTPDAHALVGPVPGIEGLIVASGFSGHGFKMGPSVGRGVASLVAGGDPGAFEAEFFAVDRFAQGRAVTSAYEYGILG